MSRTRSRSRLTVHTNETLIKERQQRGLRWSAVGIVAMFIALGAIWFPAYSNWAFPILFVGFTISLVGTYYINRWVRPPLPQEVLTKAFEELPSRYVLFNHFGPVPHLLLTPKGLVGIQAKRYEGPVRYDAAAGKWQSKFSFRRFYGRGLTAEGLGHPTEEAEQLEADLRAWLQANVPQVAEQVPVESVVLFVAPKTTLEVEEPPVPLSKPDSILTTIQRMQYHESNMPRKVYKQLRAALQANIAGAVEDEDDE